MAKADTTMKALEESVSRQVKSLDPAQRGFVLTEFSTYKWNMGKIERIQARIDSAGEDADMTPDLEAKLLKERHQLVTESASLFSHIMRWLKGTADEEDDLDRFLDGR